MTCPPFPRPPPHQELNYTNTLVKTVDEIEYLEAKLVDYKLLEINTTLPNPSNQPLYPHFLDRTIHRAENPQDTISTALKSEQHLLIFP